MLIELTCRDPPFPFSTVIYSINEGKGKRRRMFHNCKQFSLKNLFQQLKTMKFTNEEFQIAFLNLILIGKRVTNMFHSEGNEAHV